MPFYQSTADLYSAIGALFDRVTAETDAMHQFSQTHLVIRITFSDVDGEILLDARQPAVFFGKRPGRGDLELTMPADLLHRIWLGEESLRAAFFGGQIQSKGNLFRAMPLTELFRTCESFYPQILHEKGLL